MNLFVATDLSASGDAAVAMAFDWARRIGGTVTLLHIVVDPVLAPAFSDDVGGDLAAAKQALSSVAAAADVPCRIEVRAAESAAEGIVAASRDADYLFVGSQGKSAFQRLRLGSIAAKVLRHCHVPVVCCPHPEQAG